MGTEGGVVVVGWRLKMKLKMNPVSLPKPKLEGERLLIPFPAPPPPALAMGLKMEGDRLRAEQAAEESNRRAIARSNSSTVLRAMKRVQTSIKRHACMCMCTLYIL